MLDFPNNPTVNQAWPDPRIPGVPQWKWDGEKWINAGGDTKAGEASVTVGDQPPADPEEGWLWWDTVGGQLFVWYQAHWVQANVSKPPNLADFLLDAPKDGLLWGRRSGIWSEVPIPPDIPEDVSVLPVGGRMQIVGSSPSTQLQFIPFNGGWIRIDGKDYPIPALGITSGATNVYVNSVPGQTLAINTLYYVYLFNNNGTLTFDFSQSGFRTSTLASNTGTEVKFDDESRTLIGVVLTPNNIAQPFWDSPSNRYVRSWLNRPLGVFFIQNPFAPYGPTDWIDLFIVGGPFVTFQESISVVVSGSFASTIAATLLEIGFRLDGGGYTGTSINAPIAHGWVSMTYTQTLIVPPGRHDVNLIYRAPASAMSGVGFINCIYG